MTIVPRDIHQNGETRENMIVEMQNNELHHCLQQDLMTQRWQSWYMEHGNEDDEENDNREDKQNDNDVVVE